MTVSDFHAAVGGTIAALGVGATVFARTWTTTYPARHRAPQHLPPLNDLLGPSSAYTMVDPNADTQAFGVVQEGFGWCEACFDTTSGVITRNGFRCNDYADHPVRGAA